MAIREDTLVELTTELIITIIGELGQGDIDILKAELTEWVAKIKTIKDLVEKEHRYELRILV